MICSLIWTAGQDLRGDIILIGVELPCTLLTGERGTAGLISLFGTTEFIGAMREKEMKVRNGRFPR
jgi:hypothetical protein